MDEVVSRRFATDNVADKVVFFLGGLAVEDFVEILLNAGNGYGVAALKLLRPMFERVITMMHLIRHPEEVQDFLDYHHVHLRKTVNHIKAAGDDPAKYFSAEQLTEIETNYQAVKPRFLEEICKRCGTTRDGMSWTKTDLATMARNVGLGPYYVALCYFPTLQLHTRSWESAPAWRSWTPAPPSSPAPNGRRRMRRCGVLTSVSPSFSKSTSRTSALPRARSVFERYTTTDPVW
jgi:hypothetical protein